MQVLLEPERPREPRRGGPRGEEREFLLNTTVVICSANRPRVLAETVDSLLHRQRVPPREIIISVFDEAHVLAETRANRAVRVVLSPKPGTCIQRNVAAKVVRSAYTVFL